MVCFACVYALDCVVGLCRAGRLDDLRKAIEAEPQLVDKVGPDDAYDYGEEDLRPLTVMCKDGNLDMVKYLVSCGAAVDGFESDDETPLTIAIQYDRVECVRVLLEAGADVSKTNSRDPPLYCAAGRGELNVVRVLIEFGLTTQPR